MGPVRLRHAHHPRLRPRRRRPHPPSPRRRRRPPDQSALSGSRRVPHPTSTERGSDPVETASPPMIDLISSTPAAARDAVHTAGMPPFDTVAPGPIAPGTLQLEAPQPATPPCEAPQVDAAEVENLVFAVSEAVTNALIHGRPPVRFRLWTAPDRIVATVTDRGDGPADPFAGLLPFTDTCSAGLGLWLTDQLCSHVTFDTTDDGFHGRHGRLRSTGPLRPRTPHLPARACQRGTRLHPAAARRIAPTSSACPEK